LPSLSDHKSLILRLARINLVAGYSLPNEPINHQRDINLNTYFCADFFSVSSSEATKNKEFG